MLTKIIPQKTFSKQARKPTGLFGQFVMTKVFNQRNAALNDFVKEMLDVQKSDRVLEVGCGPGKLISQMAELATDGVIEGIDFSDTMLKQASKANRQHIEQGRVKLHLRECRWLPAVENSYDKICSSNTLYFWEEPEKYLGEMLRVLKPQGRVVIGFRDKQQMGRLKINEEIFNTYSQADVVRLLTDAGFTNTYLASKNDQPITSLCAVATKG